MADVPRYNPLVGSLIGVHDGDTVFIDYVLPQLDRVAIVQAIPAKGRKLRTRLARINADEMSTETGKAAAAALATLVSPLPRVVYTFSTVPDFYLPDNYGGRIDADVQLADTGVFLSDWMLENGYAAPYPPRRLRFTG